MLTTEIFEPMKIDKQMEFNRRNQRNHHSNQWALYAPEERSRRYRIRKLRWNYRDGVRQTQENQLGIYQSMQVDVSIKTVETMLCECLSKLTLT